MNHNSVHRKSDLFVIVGETATLIGCICLLLHTFVASITLDESMSSSLTRTLVVLTIIVFFAKWVFFGISTVCYIVVFLSSSYNFSLPNPDKSGINFHSNVKRRLITMVSTFIILTIFMLYGVSISLFSVSQIIISLVIGVGLSIGAALIITTSIESNRREEVQLGSRNPSLILRSYSIIGLIFLAQIILRDALPGSSILAWVITPLTLFFVPGISFGIFLLPENTRLLEWMFFAPVLSLALYEISALWLNALHIGMNTPVLFALCAGFVLFGYAGTRYRYARATK